MMNTFTLNPFRAAPTAPQWSAPQSPQAPQFTGYQTTWTAGLTAGLNGEQQLHPDIMRGSAAHVSQPQFGRAFSDLKQGTEGILTSVPYPDKPNKFEAKKLNLIA